MGSSPGAFSLTKAGTGTLALAAKTGLTATAAPAAGSLFFPGLATNFSVGQYVGGTGIAAGTTVSSLVSAAPTFTAANGVSGAANVFTTNLAAAVVGMPVTGTGLGTGATIASITSTAPTIASATAPLGSTVVFAPSVASAIVGMPVTATGLAANITAITATAPTVTTTAAQSAVGALVPYTGSVTGLFVGMPVTGTNVPAGATIASIQAGTSITLSAPTTTVIGTGIVITGTPYVTVSAATTGVVASTVTGTPYVTLSVNNSGAVASGATLTGSTGAVLSAATNAALTTATGAYATFGGNTSPAPFVLTAGTLQVYGDAALGITPSTTTATTSAVQGALGTAIPFTGSMAGWYVGMPISGANIPANSYVTAITAGTGFTINNATTTLVAASTVLTGATGAFDLNGGILATAADVTSARAFLLMAGSTLAPAAGTNFTLNGVLSGAGTLTKVGAGTLTLTAANTFVGATTVNQGALALNFANVPASTNIIPATSALTLANGSTLNLVGKAATINAQTFASTAVGAGANAINLSLNTATSWPSPPVRSPRPWAAPSTSPCRPARSSRPTGSIPRPPSSIASSAATPPPTRALAGSSPRPLAPTC